MNKSEKETLLIQCGATLEEYVSAIERAKDVLFQLNRLFRLKEGVSFSALLEERNDPLISDKATWEDLGRGFVDYPEPDQTYGAAD